VTTQNSGPSGALEPFEIHVLEIAGGSVAAIHAFLDPALFPVFGLPSTPEPVTDWSILQRWDSSDSPAPAVTNGSC
jgi:hypothetical protein